MKLSVWISPPLTDKSNIETYCMFPCEPLINPDDIVCHRRSDCCFFRKQDFQTSRRIGSEVRIEFPLLWVTIYGSWIRSLDLWVAYKSHSPNIAWQTLSHSIFRFQVSRLLTLFKNLAYVSIRREAQDSRALNDDQPKVIGTNWLPPEHPKLGFLTSKIFKSIDL